MLELAKTKKEIKVVNNERSCFTYVPDLALATKKLIEDHQEYGVYHLVNEDPVTWYEGVLRLFQIAGIKDVKITPVGPDEFPRSAKRPSSSVLINTKFPKLRSYEKAIEEWLSFCDQ
jgi:dTDP-4-dehydrorhamnose reductase